MKSIIILALLALAGPASACDITVPGCQQWMYNQGAAMQRQAIPMPIAPPQPIAPNVGMSFGTINGAPFTINRIGGWTNIQVGQ